jgi:peptide/nickel transport system substrate-binding protein
MSRPLIWDTLEWFNMADREVLEGPDPKGKAGGTGPFVFQEWVQGDHIRLVKNANYWQTGQPYLDGIEYRILSDAQAMVAQLEAGAVDMILNPPWRDMGRLQSDANYQAITNILSGSYYCLGWSVANNPLDNKLVRQAVNFALDRKRFVDTLLYGQGIPESLWWVPGTAAYEESKANFFAFDLDKAKSLLQQAGVGAFEMDYLISPNYPELADFGQIYQADLAKIGVTLTIRQVDSAPFFDAINNRKFPGMYAITSAKANLQPGTVLNNAPTSPAGNNSGFKGDRYTQLVDAASTETDPQKQKEIFSQINDLLLDAAFYTSLASARSRLLMRQEFKGLDYTMHSGFNWTGVWKD